MAAPREAVYVLTVKVLIARELRLGRLMGPGRPRRRNCGLSSCGWVVQVSFIPQLRLCRAMLTVIADFGLIGLAGTAALEKWVS
jgi:hypothetical protein